MRRKTSTDFEAGNAMAATLILASPSMYPVGSGLERWASLWMKRHSGQTVQHQEQGDIGQMTLAFEEEREAA
jgi:tetrahydromethanopterin S-methyltransferase subunit H